MKTKSLQEFSTTELVEKAHEALRNATRDALHASIQLHIAEGMVASPSPAAGDTMDLAAEQMLSASRNLGLAQKAWSILTQKQKEPK